MRFYPRPSLAFVALAMCASPLLAQQKPAMVSQPVVQPLPGRNSQMLNEALARLGRNPQDVNALIDAGNAALTLGDVDAAVGFFSRADQVQPNSPRVRAGLAGALVHSGNPYDAIPLFAEAEAAGGMDPRLNSERGLAYDLVGDNATAQKYYRAALGIASNDETIRRLALSQAIAGDRAGMESTLAPLLMRGDKAALRVHAFALAIGGQPEAGVAIAYQAMPQDLAAGIAPYLRYMPRLTRAQQAAAATFGQFPRAAEIGHDDPRALRYAPPVHVATAESTLVPSGQPLGAKGSVAARDAKDSKDRDRKDRDRKDRDRKDRDMPVQVAIATPPRVAPPDLNPRRVEDEAPSAMVKREPVKPAPAQSVPPAPAPKPAQTVAVAPKPPVQAPAGAATFDLAQVGKPAAATPPTAAPVPVPAPPPTPSLAPPFQPKQPAPVVARTETPAHAPSFSEAFGDLDAPKAVAAPASGAVDVRKIAARKAEPAKPAHPSRIWVQVGTGRDKSALGFTWRGIVKDDPDLFRSKSPSIADWGRTNRLLTGPFESESAARAFLAKLKKAGVDSFLWTSPAGQVVDPLDR